MRRPTVAEARAAVWALRALRRARRALAVDPLAAAPLPAPPAVGLGATWGVDVALGRRRATCLERATVRQAWLAASGDHRALVIGVRAPGEFAAHAWLDGEEGPTERSYVELVRRPAG